MGEFYQTLKQLSKGIHFQSHTPTRLAQEKRNKGPALLQVYVQTSQNPENKQRLSLLMARHDS